MKPIFDLKRKSSIVGWSEHVVSKFPCYCAFIDTRFNRDFVPNLFEPYFNISDPVCLSLWHFVYKTNTYACTLIFSV